MTTVFVTGGAGFIGTNLCQRLLEKGYTVTVVDNFITSSGINLKILSKSKRFTFIQHDITKQFPKSILSKKFDLIFHLACPTGVPNLVPLAEEMLLACSIGTKNVLELAKKNRATILFTSSSEVYGNPEVFPQRESYTGNVDPGGVRSPYEEGKRFSESVMQMYVRRYKVDARIVRVFNTYGPFMSMADTRVIPNFLSQAFESKSLSVQGDGSQKRTFCYIDDLVDGLLLVSQKGKKGEVYNLGSDVEITIQSLAKKILIVTKSKSTIKNVTRPSHDHARRLPSLEKVKTLGWMPTVTLSDGLKRTVKWYKI